MSDLLCSAIVTIPSLLIYFLAELSEFVLQLDEEVEGMQSKVLALEKELRELRDSAGDGGASHSKPAKEKTKSTHNGPIETFKDKRNQDS